MKFSGDNWLVIVESVKGTAWRHELELPGRIDAVPGHKRSWKS